MNNITMEFAQGCLIPAIARIHYFALPDDFLPSLGLEFLEQVYYPVAIRSEHAGTLVALADQKPVGFVTIAHDSERFTQEILRGKLFTVARYALRTMLRNPGYFGKSLEVFWSVMLTKSNPIKGEIVFIAVDQEHRGQGIGKQLVIAALDYLHQKGVTCCRTKTLAKNRGVIKMYEDLGWQVHNHFRLIGQEYVTIISRANPNDQSTYR